MSKTINPDWLEKNNKKLVEAYTIAKLKGYDISSKETTLKLLKIVDPEHTTDEYAQSFSKMLQLFDRSRKK